VRAIRSVEPALEMVADEYDVDIDVDSPGYIPAQRASPTANRSC
jgi:hypothetical protein